MLVLECLATVQWRGGFVGPEVVKLQWAVYCPGRILRQLNA